VCAPLFPPKMEGLVWFDRAGRSDGSVGSSPSADLPAHLSDFLRADLKSAPHLRLQVWGTPSFRCLKGVPSMTVLRVRHTGQILRQIVERVLVKMMDNAALRNGAMNGLPDLNMQCPDAPLSVGPCRPKVDSRRATGRFRIARESEAVELNFFGNGHATF
jgi:hypothetical protein